MQCIQGKNIKNYLVLLTWNKMLLFCLLV